MACVTESVLNITGNFLNGLVRPALYLQCAVGLSFLNRTFSPIASRRTNPPRFPSLSGEAAHVFVLLSYAHPENGETRTSCSLTRAGVSIIVARQVTGLPTAIV
jgi:hypothetical protein